MDIIVYFSKFQDRIKVHFLEHIPNLSDHIKIKVELKNDIDFNLNYIKRKMINKKWLYKESNNLWEKLT